MYRKIILYKLIFITIFLIISLNIQGAVFSDLVIPEYSQTEIKNSKQKNNLNIKEIKAESKSKNKQVKHNEAVTSVIKEIDYKFDEPEELSDDNLTISNQTELSESYLISSNPVEIKLYKKARSLEDGFFKIEINNQNKIKKDTENHNIVFLIDTSASNSGSQLNEVKNGVYNTLYSLVGKNNKFNIIEFKSDVKPLFSKYEPIDQDNINKAKKYLGGLANTGYTNIFTPVSKILKMLPVENERDLFVFLITDGQINTRSVEEYSKLILEFSKNNNKKANIFIFSNSKNSNSILLDLLAKTNNGLYKEEKRSENTAKTIEDFIALAINNNIKNISYKISDNVSKFSYPIYLPNIFTDNKINIYGYYKNNSQKINFKVVITDMNNEQQIYYFSKDISEAESIQENLEKEWGYQLLCYLFRMSMDHCSDDLNGKIIKVTKEFSIPAYYSQP